MAQASELQRQIIRFSQTYPPNSGNIIQAMWVFIFLNVCIYKILHNLIHFRLYLHHTCSLSIVVMMTGVR